MSLKVLLISLFLGAFRTKGSRAQEAGYDRKALQSLTEFRQLHRKTVDGRLCAAAFVQDGRTYTDCTAVRNPEGVSGREWCYVEVQLLGKGARDWDYCQEVINYEAVRVAFRDIARKKTEEMKIAAAFFRAQEERLRATLRKHEQLCVAASAAAERMQSVQEILGGAPRALEELRGELSKLQLLQGMSSNLAAAAARDESAGSSSSSKLSCGALRGYEEEPGPDGLRATIYSNAAFGGPPAGFQDFPLIDFKAQGLNPFWGAPQGAPLGAPLEAFSVRWEGFLQTQVSETFRIFTVADCGARVFLEDSPILVDRMPIPQPAAAAAAAAAAEPEKLLLPLPPASFTGVTKVFSSPQELKAGHKYRLKVEYFHLASHKFKNPDSARMMLGWTSATVPEQPIPAANFFQSASPPLLKLGGLPGGPFDLASLEDGQLAFSDSSQHFLADVPALYRGLLLLRAPRGGPSPPLRFEASAQSTLFVALPRGAPGPPGPLGAPGAPGAPGPAPFPHPGFQPLKFAHVDNTISVYTAASREAKATEQQFFSLYSSKTLPGMIAFAVPPGVPFFVFFQPLRSPAHSCEGTAAAAAVSLPRSATFESCSQSSAVSAQHDCSAGLAGLNLDLPFGSWRTAPGRGVGEQLMVAFKVPVEIWEVQFKTLDDPLTWPTEIAVEFPGLQESHKFAVRPGDHSYQFPPKVVRGVLLRITGKRSLDTSAGTGGSLAFIGVPCVQKKEPEEKEDKYDEVKIVFGESVSGFVPAGFQQDDGSPKAAHFPFTFGWDHRAVSVHPKDCSSNLLQRSGVSFPQQNCTAAERCSPLIDCDYPNGWSIDMHSLGQYLVTVEVGAPCGDLLLTNLKVNEVPFVANELLHAGQYTKVVGQITLTSSPTIRLSSDTRVTLQAVLIQKIRPTTQQQQQQQQQQQAEPLTPVK